jgi:hypothetical protein
VYPGPQTDGSIEVLLLAQRVKRAARPLEHIELPVLVNVEPAIRLPTTAASLQLLRLNRQQYEN